MSNIKYWSTAAASNNSSPPDGFPEGMAPSSLNDGIRETMGSIRRWYEDAQWIDYNDTPTYVSASTFTVAGDKKTRYETGRRIRASVGSSTLYGIIDSSTYTAATGIYCTLDSGSLTTSLTAVAVGILTNSNTSVPNKFDVINERSAAAGVTVDGVLLKDGNIVSGNISAGGNVSISGAATVGGILTIGPTYPGNARIELGRVDGVASSPLIDFHSGATAVDYDVRLFAIGGTGVDGGGSLAVSGASFSVNVINERAVAAGVTVDGCLIKDSKAATAIFADSATWANSASACTRAQFADSATWANSASACTRAQFADSAGYANTASVSTAVNDGTNVIKTKIIDIGDWNMNVTLGGNSSKSVAHGLTFSKIRSVTAMVRDDGDTRYDMIVGSYIGTGALSEIPAVIQYTGSVNVVMVTKTAGSYDNSSFDSTAYNRGWITITYVV